MSKKTRELAAQAGLSDAEARRIASEAARAQAEAAKAEAEAKKEEAKANAEAKRVEAEGKKEANRIENERKQREETLASTRAEKLKRYKEGVLGTTMGIVKPVSFVAGTLGGGLTAKGISHVVKTPRGAMRGLAAIPYATVAGIGLWKSRELAGQARNPDGTPFEADANKAVSNFLLGQAAGSASGGAKYVLKDIAQNSAAKIMAKEAIEAQKSANALAQAKHVGAVESLKTEKQLAAIKKNKLMPIDWAPKAGKFQVPAAAPAVAAPAEKAAGRPAIAAMRAQAKSAGLKGYSKLGREELAKALEKVAAPGAAEGLSLAKLAKGKGGKVGMALALGAIGVGFMSSYGEARAEGLSRAAAVKRASIQAGAPIAESIKNASARDWAENAAELAFPVTGTVYELGKQAYEATQSKAGAFDEANRRLAGQRAQRAAGQRMTPTGVSNAAPSTLAPIANSGRHPGWSVAARRAAAAARMARAK